MLRSQIETVLKLDWETRNVFNGVFAMDMLPEHVQPGATVINTDDSDEPGSHWCCVFKDGETQYMDSYGLPPTDQRCLDFLGETFSFNTLPLQLEISNTCGFYCIYFIIKRAMGIPANVVLETLHRSDSEYVVKDYVYSRYKNVF